MCGILAQYFPASGTSLETVRNGLEVLHHRGPDASGVWQSANREVALGHARLSIVDLVTGEQPLANEDGSIRVVVNGEFYGYQTLRLQLEARGHSFKTKSDSEILPHLYEEYGVECLRHLRGEFAFILWDARKNTLFAARDRFGIKPLFYAECHGGVALASEVKALHACGIDAAWDENGLLQTLSMLGSIDGTTLFRNVRTLPPANYLLASAGSISLHPYWDFDYPEEHAIEQRPDEEHAERFRAAFEEAIRLRMQADVPVGCYLSGGLDSCGVLASMARLTAKPVHAFSLTFDHAAYDESSMAREMAQLAGAEISLITVTSASLARDFSDAVWHAETLFANPHGVAKFALSRAVHNAGYKVVLTGEGADETLAGYPIFRMDVERQSHPSYANEANEGTAPFLDRLGYVPAWYAARETVMRRIGGFVPAFHSSDCFTRLLNQLDIARQMTGRHVLNQSLYLHSKVVLPGYVLTVMGDRMEMAHSVEGRVPFLDHKLVELLRTLPANQKIRGNTEKYVLRQALRPVLTSRVYARPKHAFLTPPVLPEPGGPLYAMMQDTLRGGILKTIPLLVHAAVIDTLDRIPRMDDWEKKELEAPFMALFSACVLAERFGL